MSFASNATVNTLTQFTIGISYKPMKKTNAMSYSGKIVSRVLTSTTRSGLSMLPEHQDKGKHQDQWGCDNLCHINNRSRLIISTTTYCSGGNPVRS